MKNNNDIVEFLADIFKRRGGDEYLGEPVTMAEHMLQSAYAAEQNGESESVVVAALLHDIGHFTSEFGTFSMNDTTDKFHEQAGADILEQWFQSEITDCVRYHVAAKRYLCATDASYLDKLSDASVHSLGLQGGPMSLEEVEEFKRNPNLETIVKVRLFDDAAKVTGLTTPNFSHYRAMIRNQLRPGNTDTVTPA